MTSNRDMPNQHKTAKTSWSSQHQSPPLPDPFSDRQSNFSTVETAQAPIAVAAKDRRGRRWGWIGWQFWALLVMVVFGGVGFTATKMLLSLPSATSCSSIFWPLASASQRIYCAQAEAEKQTLEGLKAAIALVEDLPADHPMRAEIDRHIANWSEQILELAELKFQRGEYEAAIATAKAIPSHLKAYESVDQTLARWQSIWSEATERQAAIREQLQAGNWNQAFRIAIQLTEVDNQYWATTRYEALLQEIQVAREDSRILAEAQANFERGQLTDLVTALDQAQQLDPKSYSYDRAQKLIQRIGDELLALAQRQLDQENWQAVQETVRAIPDQLNLKVQVLDLLSLAQAGMQAQLGSIPGLESAIAQASQLEIDSSLYGKAQFLIDRWEREISDLEHLKLAKELAAPGSIPNLEAAIEEAQQIPRANPRYQEARELIADWTYKIQVIEDRPILARAERLARGNTISAWREAIATANQIAPRRALYNEAQRQIGQWRSNIQRTEDQPILSYAESLANAGQLENAIAVAAQIQPNRVLYNDAQRKIRQWQETIERIEDQPILARAQSLANADRLEQAISVAAQIRPNRVLYREAQAKIERWQTELQARDRLRRAYRQANAQTPEALASAIRLAVRIPTSTTVYPTSTRAVERWSEQLFDIALEVSQNDLVQAIQIAEQIPSQSSIYDSVQAQIQLWQETLAPPEPESPEVELEAAPLTET